MFIKSAAAALAVFGAAGASQACLPHVNSSSCTFTFDFNPAGDGVFENPCVAGAARICFDSVSGNSSLRLGVIFLQPNETYWVHLSNADSGDQILSTFMTNWLGAAAFTELEIQGNYTIEPTITLFINELPNLDPFGAITMEPDEIRAVTDHWF